MGEIEYIDLREKSRIGGASAMVILLLCLVSRCDTVVSGSEDCLNKGIGLIQVLIVVFNILILNFGASHRVGTVGMLLYDSYSLCCLEQSPHVPCSLTVTIPLVLDYLAGEHNTG